MKDSLTRSRLDSFSDGVMAVIITIMVLELKVPTVHDVSSATAALRADAKMLAVYLLSFVQTGIYWVNHHYLLDDVEHVTHGILWANLALLFCLSLIPFGTEWIGVRGVESMPVVVYILCFLAPAAAWTALSEVIRRHTGVRPAASLAKQIFSLATNLAAIAVAFLSPWAALGMVAIVAIAWLVPPRVIVEKTRRHSRAQ